MSGQEIAACLIGAIALAYLLLRRLRRRRSTNCCGERECPVAKQTIRNLDRP
jgi:hypothetical protein